MYRFSYVKGFAGKAMEVNKELFHQIINDERVTSICAQIAALNASPSEAGEGTDKEISKLKRKLPAFCWHAWFDEGKRKNDLAHPSGLIMIDVDHIKEPRTQYNEVAERAKELGLLAAHVTPSTKGLRLVFPMPQSAQGDLERAQTLIVKALHLSSVDACTKDLARLSFCVPQDYFLYLDEERLFEGEEVICEPVVATPDDTDDEDNRYSSLFNGVPYAMVVACLEEQLGGVPSHGSRNNFIFAMASYLRYVCNDDPEWIAHILPTYGEGRDKWRRTLDSACQRSQSREVPPIMRRALEMAKQRQQQEMMAVDMAGRDLPPSMPEQLPPLVAHLVKNVPEVCRPSVANGIFPSLATHLHGVYFYLVDGTEKEPTFMCVNIARQSTGKSAINKPIRYITADIVARDKISRQRELEWKKAMSTKGANKDKPERPDDLCVQVLVSDMTNAAFVQRMEDAGDRYLYTNLEELDLLKQLQTNGSKDVSKIICLCFDNGTYGQERVGMSSVNACVDVRWNWNASTTVQKGIDFFRGSLVDGTLSRINFCTIIPDKSKPFVYGKYTEEYAEALKPYIDNLNLANGCIECEEALEMARRLSEQCIEEGDLTDDEVYQDLIHRAVTIAYMKAMVLYIAHGMTWSDEIAQFMEWSLHYDLWCKMHFFGTVIDEGQSHERVKKPRGRRNLLELLPDTFSLEQAMEMRKKQGMSDEVYNMLCTWTIRGYIERDEVSKLYVKTPAYLERHPSA